MQTHGPLTRTLREKLRSVRCDLAEAYHKAPEVQTYLHAYSKQVDEILTEIWHELKLPSELALAAVGGFGRGELYPASDIDILILLPQEPDTRLTPRLEQLISLLWDIGLQVGHSIRTLKHCLTEAGQDITVQTALLESRLICGDQDLYVRFTVITRGQINPQHFFMAKSLEQKERHLRYQESAYNLEPNCKESPGGLRDLQNILWIAQACGYGARWEDLTQHQLITPAEQLQIECCERYLQGLRISLHLLTERREDRLLFDYQTALARALGVSGDGTRMDSEVLMQAYYRNAKLVMQLNTILLQNMAVALFPSESTATYPLDADFRVEGDFLDIQDEHLFKHKPETLLKSFLLLQQHPDLRGMTAKTLRALWRSRHLVDTEFRQNPENRQTFLHLFQENHHIMREFQRMNEYDILGCYLPAFGKIVGQMQHDLFHVYTVDQHILMVMRNLRRLTREEFAHEHPFCSQLINAFPRPWVLYIAALFHDIAKGRKGDHSLLGMEDARQFCEEHALPKEDSDLIVWLVQHHLTMSQVAQKEDISNPEVVAEFAAIVQSKRRLTALYLLTVADIRGTSPKVWNSWKANLLESLYQLTLGHLETGKHLEPQGVIEERQAEALRLLRYFALSDTVHERLWKQLDTVYFLRHTAEEIAWHTRALHYRIHIDQPVVKARLQPGGGLQVMVYTEDRPDLFLRLLSFFARSGYSIMDARIHTTRHGYALDSFVLLDISSNANDREMIQVIEHELSRILEQGLPPEAPASGRLSRRARHFPIIPEIHIEASERQGQYVLAMIAADRPGLLFHIARILAQHHTQVITARISTLGDRVEDTFLITGETLENSTSRLKLESDLLGVLQTTPPKATAQDS